MKCVTDSIGLSWTEIEAALIPNSSQYTEIETEWRAMTSYNVSLLQPFSQWGVPCVKYKDEFVVWGQDKIFFLEQYLAYVHDKTNDKNVKGMVKAKAKAKANTKQYNEDVIQVIRKHFQS